MKSFILILLGIIVALLIVGGAVAYSFMNELGVNMENIDSNTVEKIKDKVLEHKQPVIVFGDHTRVVKYIDFDFIVGADGVKILSPMIDSKYFYYLILNTSENIKNRGYGRHFGLLSKEEYFIPPLKEQHRIVSLLETIEKQLDTISAEL